MSVMKYWIWLASRKGIGQRSVVRILDRFGGPEKIFFASESDYKAAGLQPSEIRALSDKSMLNVTKTIVECSMNKIRIIAYSDAEYPERLRNISDPPTVLYVKGTMPVMDDEAAVAMIGTRSCTPYGIKMAEKIGYEFAMAGGTVVSGLAKGIDSAAARGALRAGGKVIGVLGCGLDIVYPPENKSLFKDVVRTGAIISEYPPGTPPARTNFPARNRIMSGISNGAAVIEAPEKSGALITASHALDQGRDVFAVPGNADAEACGGSNRLLREGATVLTSGWELAEEYMALFPEKLSFERRKMAVKLDEHEAEKLVEKEIKTEKKAEHAPKKVVDKDDSQEYIDVVTQDPGLSENEKKAVSAIGGSTAHIDDIIEKTGMSAADALSALTMLEIKGVIKQLPGKEFVIYKPSK